MLGNFELLSLLLPEEIRDKLMLLDPDLSPEEQFNGLMELIKNETGLDITFDKSKSLRDNLKPILDQMSVTEKAKCNKMLKFVEAKIDQNKNNKNVKLIEKESEVNNERVERSKSVDTKFNPDFLYFK